MNTALAILLIIAGGLVGIGLPFLLAFAAKAAVETLRKDR